MKIRNPIIIEDSHNQLNKSILLKESNMYNIPMSMSEIEEFEDHFIYNKIPYVLAQVEVTLSDPPRYSKGYVLFTELLVGEKK